MTCLTVDVMGVYKLGNVAFRLALLRAWGHRCERCKEPITYIELHVDHFIPKSLDEAGLSKAKDSFCLPKDYDLHETCNLVPSCGPCNISKGNTLPLANHLTLETMETARNLAPEIEKKADKLKKMLSAPVTSTLAQIDAHRDNPEVIQELLDYLMSIKQSQVIEPELTFEFLLSESVRLGLSSDGSSQIFRVGDCPNTNCIAGEINWKPWDDGELGQMKAGECYSCGTRAVSCPECGTATGFFGDEVDCDGFCGKRFRIVEHDGGLGFMTVS